MLKKIKITCSWKKQPVILAGKTFALLKGSKEKNTQKILSFGGKMLS